MDEVRILSPLFIKACLGPMQIQGSICWI
jgi:hypothetical protein